jgi:hypothetical protein
MVDHFRQRWSALFLVLVNVELCAKGGDAGDESAERAATLARLTRIVESYSISIGDDRTEPLELVKSPLLHYSDQVSPVNDGLVFAWTKAGRPEAVMALHPGTQGNTWIEFKSLSLSPLTAVRQGHVEWRPRTPGVDFQPLKDVAAPEPTDDRKRLTQMRSMLRPFTASVWDNVNGSQPLRLLPQPLFRYAQPERGILDGALFAFVLSTNPELLLVVEAQTIDDKPEWMYSIARFTGRRTELRFEDRPIWPMADLPSTKDAKAPFFQLRTLIAE